MLFKNAALFLAGATAVVAQSAQTVVADLNSIKSQTQSLTTQLSNFDGTVQGGIPILSATTKLKSATAKAISDANAVPSGASDSDQASVLQAAESLYPVIVASLQAFVKDIPKFKSAGISSVSDSSLAQLKSQSATLGAALASKATGDFKTAATAINNAIAAAFSSAQAGTSPQTTQLPPIPSGGGSSGGSSSKAASSAAATSKAASSMAASSKAMSAPAYTSAAASTPAGASTPAATPSATPAPPAGSSAAPAPIASSAAPAPAYTGAAGKHVANVGGAVLLAAAAFAL